MNSRRNEWRPISTLSRFGGLLLLVGANALFGSCSDVNELADCLEICRNYENCIDSTFDSSECADRCEDRADVDEAFATQLDDCEDCLDDTSCAEAEACRERCAGIGPIQGETGESS